MLLEMQTVDVVPLLVALLFGVTAAITDWRMLKIPNWVTLPLLLAGLVFHSVAPDGKGLGFAALGCAAGFGCLILFYVMGGIGAGDVKFLAATGSWLGPQVVFGLFLVASLLAVLYAVALSLREGRLRHNALRVLVVVRQGMAVVRHVGGEEQVEEVAGRHDRHRRLVPFAVMILGAVAILAAWRIVST